MILHIPHASTYIPHQFADYFVTSPTELTDELRLMTDAFTDILFCDACAAPVRFGWSRLLVDVERFADDEQEPMARPEIGMGVIYNKRHNGLPLKRALSASERALLMAGYHQHHQRLTQAVEDELLKVGSALLVDCHSFPSTPLPCDQDQHLPRPDICIGTDDFHTPDTLARLMVTYFETAGFTVKINRPYAGSLVPIPYYQVNSGVTSMMIEVNRRLYMDESTGKRLRCFSDIAGVIKGGLTMLSRAHSQSETS